MKVQSVVIGDLIRPETGLAVIEDAQADHGILGMMDSEDKTKEHHDSSFGDQVLHLQEIYKEAKTS